MESEKQRAASRDDGDEHNRECSKKENVTFPIYHSSSPAPDLIPVRCV
jgi:hypothetical protein